jgi:ATP-binding cassette, subfamily C (CFTR/MRP), member 1
VEENIIFGRKKNNSFLTKVIKATSLDIDLESMPLGIYSEIGEKGINLSGG